MPSRRRHTHPIVPVSILRFISALVVVAVASCSRGAQDQAGRRFTDLSAPSLSILSTDRLMSSDVDDALLVGTNIVFLQATDARVTAVNGASGRVAWMFGARGAGPGEFAAPSGLFGRIGGGVGVVDPRQGRITLLTSTGELDGSISGTLLDREPHNVCDAGATGLLAIRLPRFDIVRATFEGEVLVQDSLVWPDERMNHVMQLQQGLFARSRGGRCVVFAVRGDFWAEFDVLTTKPKGFFRYLETFEFPKIVKQRNGFSVLEDSRTSATYAAVSGDHLFVLTGGDDATKGRIIDVYALADGAYHHSIRLPRPAYEIDVDGNRLLVLERTDDGARLDLYPLPSTSGRR